MMAWRPILSMGLKLMSFLWPMESSRASPCSNTLQFLVQHDASLCIQGGWSWNPDHIQNRWGIFNTQRLKAKTKVTSSLVRDLLYADDCGIVAHSEKDLQMLTYSLSEATKKFGLTISIKKTEVLFQPAKASAGSPPQIQIDGKVLSNVDSFTYLGN